ncbi:MAG TPA: DUF5666 domain-containing protein [Gaiellaceae bacterium]
MKKLLILLVAAVTASVALGATSPALAKKKNKGPAVHGIVQSVASDSITLKLKNGNSATIQVSSDTKIVVNHKPGTLADIEVGYRASVKGKKGQPAKLIRAYEAPAADTVVHGLVDSVGSDSITIKEKDGDSVTIAVNSETKIRVNGKPGALGDIEAGYRAIVHRTSADGPAKALKAYERHGAKSYFRGVVESVGSDSLTVKLRNGSSVTVAVTAATQVRLAGQGLVALSDLKAGYRVNVLRASADGPALVIIARAPKA